MWVVGVFHRKLIIQYKTYNRVWLPYVQHWVVSLLLFLYEHRRVICLVLHCILRLVQCVYYLPYSLCEPHRVIYLDSHYNFTTKAETADGAAQNNHSLEVHCRHEYMIKQLHKFWHANNLIQMNTNLNPANVSSLNPPSSTNLNQPHVKYNTIRNRPPLHIKYQS